MKTVGTLRLHSLIRVPEGACSSRFPTAERFLRTALAITEDQHNKTLQLSPRRSPEAVHAVPNSMQGWVDAAAQLSSMLC
jgi:hypothetical protein